MFVDRPETHREEIVNAITHALGFALSIAGLTVLVVLAARLAEPWRIVTFSVYGASLVLLYLASTCYHIAPAGGRAKNIFRSMDHCAIYVLIAGTYTPFMLVSLGGAWGWSLFAILWALALAGVLVKSCLRPRSSILSTVLYVAMGWAGLVAAGPIVRALPVECIVWVLAGGAAYTLGVIFFLAGRLPYNHAIWHLFVIKGSVCHFLAVLLYVLPLT